MNFALILLVFLACSCVVCLGGGSGSNVHRSNLVRDTGSKRLRNPDEAPEGSNASQRRTKYTTTKQKEPVMGMDEMPHAEFVIRKKLNPYVNPRANFRGNDLFWTKQQNLIYLDVIKAKQNIYVDVH